MAKKAVSKKQNKTAVIREYLAANPKAMPKQAIPALKEKGIEVSPTYFSMVKGKLNGRGGKRRRMAAAVQGNGAKRRGRPKRNGVTIEQLITAKTLAERMGGVVAAREALDVLARLS